MGYPKETQIYVASGQVYGGQSRMAPLRNMFPNLKKFLSPLSNTLFKEVFRLVLVFKCMLLLEATTAMKSLELLLISILIQVMKEELANKEKLDGFKKHVTTLAALDLLVCLKSDLFVMTHGGNVFENTLC